MDVAQHSNTTAVAVVAQFELSEPAQAQLTPHDTPLALLDKLAVASLWLDALRLVAYTLGKRDAVWWACLCVTQAGIPASPLQQTALAAAQAWLDTGDEVERRLASSAAKAAGLDNGAGCAALAAFWSGGSIAPVDAPAVPPAAHLCHHAAACAAILAGVVNPAQANSYYSQFVALGKKILAGDRP